MANKNKSMCAAVVCSAVHTQRTFSRVWPFGRHAQIHVEEEEEGAELLWELGQMGNTFDRDLAYILSAGGERAMDKKIRGRRGFLGRLP